MGAVPLAHPAEQCYSVSDTAISAGLLPLLEKRRAEKSLSLGPSKLCSVHCVLPFSEIKDCIFRIIWSFDLFLFPWRPSLLLQPPCPHTNLFLTRDFSILLDASLWELLIHVWGGTSWRRAQMETFQINTSPGSSEAYSSSLLSFSQEKRCFSCSLFLVQSKKITFLCNFNHHWGVLDLCWRETTHFCKQRKKMLWWPLELTLLSSRTKLFCQPEAALLWESLTTGFIVFASWNIVSSSGSVSGIRICVNESFPDQTSHHIKVYGARGRQDIALARLSFAVCYSCKDHSFKPRFLVFSLLPRCSPGKFSPKNFT